MSVNFNIIGGLNTHAGVVILLKRKLKRPIQISHSKVLLQIIFPVDDAYEADLDLKGFHASVW